MSDTILKIGGSLLDAPDIAGRILAFIDQCPGPAPLIVVGGGAAADLVRDFDRASQMDDHEAHDLAIHAMSFNSRLLAATHPRFMLCTPSATDSSSDSIRILEPVATLLELAAVGSHAESNLPHSWDVTSDSIAAWIARRVGANRLMLAKSTKHSLLANSKRNRPAVLKHLAQLRLVDTYFNRVAALMQHLDWVNLRDDHPVVESLW